MTPPLDSLPPGDAPIVALAGPRKLARRLEEHGYRLLLLSPGANPVTEARTTPRLVLLASRDLAESRVVDQVKSVRRLWPLVDTLVLAPAASAKHVRALLHAGARDVVLEEDETTLFDTLELTLDAQQLLPMIDRLAEQRVRSSRFEGMLSRSHAMWDVFETCVRVAPTNANVLICGETGTGKDRLARALHRLSKRTGRFVAINCSSLPAQLIESELFGHEKGAFTGATAARRGMFRSAEGGTVLLDEIGDMPLAAQQSLLRVLEARTVRPVGSPEEIPIDVRVLAATHVSLEEAMARGEFREDLFYRLDVIRLDVPPLRDRPEDVVYLFGHFAKSLAKQYGVEQPKTNDEFLARLAAHPWPGNIRELENFTERIVLRGKRTLTARDFTRGVRAAHLASDAPTERSPVEEKAVASSTTFETEAAIDTTKGLEETLQPIIDQLELRYLELVLSETEGRMQDAARLAGVSRRTLQRKLGVHGIEKSRFRTR